MKTWLGGQSFQRKEELQSKAQAHLTSLAATFFEEGIGNLGNRYDKCLNLQGDYAEKQPCLNITFGSKFILSSTLLFFYGPSEVEKKIDGRLPLRNGRWD
ncbi:hypothetical protein AVEN_76733-1 [Araneus ventricosus]|uniref:Uncharacterized protein n=1 Tax=Araneus ventricosus TaxID=182803 RepID=A0A4Y2N095_ARAVE|nr:hypothetical protein AVEN_76733-1 [Araneus ventricosus]